MNNPGLAPSRIRLPIGKGSQLDELSSFRGLSQWRKPDSLYRRGHACQPIAPQTTFTVPKRYSGYKLKKLLARLPIGYNREL